MTINEDLEVAVTLAGLLRQRVDDRQPCVLDPRAGTIRYGKAIFDQDASGLFRMRRELAEGRTPEGVPCDKCGKPTSAYLTDIQPFLFGFTCRKCGHCFVE